MYDIQNSLIVVCIAAYYLPNTQFVFLICGHVRRRSLEVRWKLHAALYCQNIGSKLVDHVKVALYCQRPVFVLGTGKFSCRIKRFKG